MLSLLLKTMCGDVLMKNNPNIIKSVLVYLFLFSIVPFLTNALVSIVMKGFPDINVYINLIISILYCVILLSIYYLLNKKKAILKT